MFKDALLILFLPLLMSAFLGPCGQTPGPSNLGREDSDRSKDGKGIILILTVIIRLRPCRVRVHLPAAVRDPGDCSEAAALRPPSVAVDSAKRAP